MSDASAALPGRRRDTSRDVLGWVVFGLVGIVVYAHLYFTVEFTDSAYSVALQYSFSLGHRPLVDELAVQQLAGLMLQPFIELYLALVGSQSGIVLFARHLYFATAFTCALLARNYLAHIFGARAGSLVATVALAYVPFHIASLSYNTIAYFGLFAGAILYATAFLPGRSMANLFAGTLAMASASFAYPTIVVASLPSVAFGLAGVWLLRERAQRKVALGLIATAGFGSAAIGLFDLLRRGGGMRELNDMIELSAMARQGGGLIKVNELAREVGIEGPYLLAMLLVLTVVFYCYRAVPNAVVAATATALLGPALVLIAPLYVAYTEPYTTTPFTLSAAALASPLVLRALRHRLTPAEWWGLASVTTTSLLAGTTFLWSTSNGLRNGPLGFLPAALVTLAGLSLLRRPGRTPASLSSQSLIFTLLLASPLVYQLHLLWTESYRDRPAVALGTVVERGAWKGIRTTPIRKDFIETLEDDLDRLRGDAETVFFFDYFPGGYLMSDLRPRAPTLWLLPYGGVGARRAIRPVYARHFDDGLPLPDMVVRMKCVPTRRLFKLRLPDTDAVARRIFQAKYDLVSERQCYKLFKKTSETAPPTAPVS